MRTIALWTRSSRADASKPKQRLRMARSSTSRIALSSCVSPEAIRGHRNHIGLQFRYVPAQPPDGGCDSSSAQVRRLSRRGGPLPRVAVRTGGDPDRGGVSAAARGGPSVLRALSLSDDLWRRGPAYAGPRNSREAQAPEAGRWTAGVLQRIDPCAGRRGRGGG